MAETSASVTPELKKVFTVYTRIGSSTLDNNLNFNQLKTWILSSKLTTPNVNMNLITPIFNRFKADTITYEQFETILPDIAKSLNISGEELKRTLIAAHSTSDNNLSAARIKPKPNNLKKPPKDCPFQPSCTRDDDYP